MVFTIPISHFRPQMIDFVKQNDSSGRSRLNTGYRWVHHPSEWTSALLWLWGSGWTSVMFTVVCLHFLILTSKKLWHLCMFFPLVCEKHGQLGLCKGCLSAGIMELQKEASHQRKLLMQGIISQNLFGWVIPASLLLKCVGSLVLFMFLDATVEMSDLYCCLWSSMQL